MLMLTDYAVLAGHIYDTQKRDYMGHPVIPYSRSEIPDRIKILPRLNGWVRIKDIDSAHMSDAQACYAQLYLNMVDNQVNQAVVAVRGTHSFQNILADIKTFTADGAGLTGSKKLHAPSDTMLLSRLLSWGDDNVVSYIGKLYNFYEQAVDYVFANFPKAYMLNGVSLTGHSLGGALAKLLVLTSSIGHAPVVAFNAPGCGNIEGVHPAMFPLIYNANARYDVVSKIDTPVGHLCWVDVPDQKDGAKMLLTTYVDKHPFPTSEPDPTQAHPEFGNLHLNNVNLKTPNANDPDCAPESLGNLSLSAAKSGIVGVTAKIAIKEAYCAIDTGKVDINILMAQHSMANLLPALLNNAMIGTRLVLT